MIEEIINELRELSKDYRHNFTKNSKEQRAWKLGIEDCIDTLILYKDKEVDKKKQMTNEEFEEEKERLIQKDLSSVENRIRHTFNQGVELGRKMAVSEDLPRKPWKYSFENGYVIRSEYYLPMNILKKEIDANGKVTVNYETDPSGENKTA